MQQHSTVVAVSRSDGRPAGSSLRHRAKSVGVVCIAAALAGALSLPAAAFLPRAEAYSAAQLASIVAENTQQVVVAPDAQVDLIARAGISGTTAAELEAARAAAREAEEARQAELAAAREAAAAAAAAVEAAAVEAAAVEAAARAAAGDASQGSASRTMPQATREATGTSASGVGAAAGAASGTTTAAAPAANAPAAAPASVPANGSIVAIAQSQLGKPYVWGGASPSTGFDCSGFTMWVMGQAGHYLPHSSNAQARYGTPVSPSAVVAGDLIVWKGHVAIYAGGDQIIHAATSGKPIKYSSYSGMVAAFGTPEARRFG